MTNSRRIERLLREAAEEYNMYRSPEAEVGAIAIEGREILVKMAGSFCTTCGFYDWVEDFGYVLREKGVKAELKRVEEKGDTFLAVFVIGG